MKLTWNPQSPLLLLSFLRSVIHFGANQESRIQYHIQPQQRLAGWHPLKLERISSCGCHFKNQKQIVTTVATRQYPPMNTPNMNHIWKSAGGSSSWGHFLYLCNVVYRTIVQEPNEFPLLHPNEIISDRKKDRLIMWQVHWCPICTPAI